MYLCVFVYIYACISVYVCCVCVFSHSDMSNSLQPHRL